MMTGPANSYRTKEDELLLESLEQNALLGSSQDAAASIATLGKEIASRFANELAEEGGAPTLIEYVSHIRGTLREFHELHGPRSATALYLSQVDEGSGCAIWMHRSLVSILATVFMGGKSSADSIESVSLSGMEMAFFRMLAENLTATLSLIANRSIPLPKFVTGPDQDMGAPGTIAADLFELRIRSGQADHILAVALSGIASDKISIPPQLRKQNIERLKRLRVLAEFHIHLDDMTLGDLSKLRTSDVITLSPESLSNCEISVAGHNVLTGQCGQVGSKISVRINGSGFRTEATAGISGRIE
jgi:flagellar motor switch protein FliM